MRPGLSNYFYTAGSNLNTFMSNLYRLTTTQRTALVDGLRKVYGASASNSFIKSIAQQVQNRGPQLGVANAVQPVKAATLGVSTAAQATLGSMSKAATSKPGSPMVFSAAAFAAASSQGLGTVRTEVMAATRPVVNPNPELRR